MVICKLVLIITVILQFIFVPKYLKAMWPTKNKKSLMLKTLCSSLFLVAGVMCMVIAKNTSTFAWLILGGLIMSWIGDFLLHVNPKTVYFLLGITSFFCGHVFYIASYFNIQNARFPEEPLFSSAEIISIILIVAVGFIVAKIGSIKPGGKKNVAAILYAWILATMTVKAVSLAVKIGLSGAPLCIPAAVVLSVGAINFLLSDSSLAFIYFSPRKSFGLKCFNMATYYIAQMLLAMTILFI